MAVPEALNDPAYKPLFCVGIRTSVAGLLLNKQRVSDGSLKWLNSMAKHCGIEEYKQQ
jgi:hypothetical protein